jgi:hypothetical protein
MANITVTLFWDMDLRKWTTTLGGTTETSPQTGIVQGDIVKFAIRFVQSGAAVVLAAPVFTASSIKAQNDFTGSYLIQLSAPVLSETTLYTFTVSPLNSANLNTFLQTYRNTWCALEIYDSANGILTTPLELQITPGYSLSGTPTDNAPGVVSVAAGKTVTFPLSLTFPAAAGTNGFQLTTDGAGALTWTAGGALTDGDKGEITVSNSGATFTIDNDVVTLAKLAHMPTARVIGRTTAGNGTPELLTISGTGSVAMTTDPQFTTPSLGAATATSINGNTILSGTAALLPAVGKFRSADLVRSSTSFVTDADFAVPVAAGQTWSLHYRLFFVEGNGAGAKAQLDFTGMTVSAALGFGSIAGSSTTASADLILDGTSPAGILGTTDDGYHQFDYTVTLTATVGGTVNLQWGCSAAFDVTLNSRSSVIATRLA